MTIKSRESLVPVSTGSLQPGGSWQEKTGNVSLGWQQIVSHSNPHWLLGKSDGDIGGPFTSIKSKWSGLPSPVHLQGDLTPSTQGWQSKGILVPSLIIDLTRPGSFASAAGFDSALNMPKDSVEKMESLGTTAIARTLPTSPVFDGATAVAELYSGIPAMPGGAFVNTRPDKYFRGNVLSEATRDAPKVSDVGNDYLNYQFAVAPTIDDVRSLRHAAENSEKIIAQLERDSGKVIRRKYAFPVEESTIVEFDVGQSFAYLGGNSPTAYEMLISHGRLTQRSTYSLSRRFSGAFVYHLPPKGTWRRKIAQLDAVYGIKPGIDTAWNAVPFSWMADWYGNMGDVMTNLNAFASDGVALKYGYITSRSRRTITYDFSIPIRPFGSMNEWKLYSGTLEFAFTSLTRVPAAPFGFGLSGGVNSPRRAAIVAALGISRTSR
jgi:hypothetical protein